MGTETAENPASRGHAAQGGKREPSAEGAQSAAGRAASAPYDLAVVMPVYNEQGCIREVLQSWRAAVSHLGIRFLIMVLNDGSTDGTADALAAFEDDPRIIVVNKRNSGHGPTILMGYGRAIELADWIFQCDSDNEMKPGHLAHLWRVRESYDALFGERTGRSQAIARKVISAGSRLTVRLLFGKGVRDVNVPYRLIRSAVLRRIVKQIPQGAFAPNVIISGAAAKAGLRIYNCPVPFEQRRTGRGSLASWRQWRAALKSFWQTLKCCPALCQAARGSGKWGTTMAHHVVDRGAKS